VKSHGKWPEVPPKELVRFQVNTWHSKDGKNDDILFFLEDILYGTDLLLWRL
jgi:hypothetical protein